MKYVFGIAAMLLAASSQASTVAQDSTGLPGDHFSLQGALDLFKRSKSLEDFEKALNKEDNKVNNLDLDQDGTIDYVRVVDHAKGDAHAIVMQVPVNKQESQDVAVIELEKKGEGSAAVQIRGDEDLYGPEVIIQPKMKEENVSPSHGERGPLAPEAPVFFYVNVWSWPCVYWMYGPSYVMWDSPFYWGYYPPWWHPWHPYHWHDWYGWQSSFHYHNWYEPTNVVYVEQADVLYQHRRTHAPSVVNRVREQRPSINTRDGARPNNVVREKPTRTDRPLNTDEARPRQKPTDAPVRPTTPRDRDRQIEPQRTKPQPAPERVRPTPKRERPAPERVRPAPERPQPAPRPAPNRTAPDRAPQRHR